MLSVVRAVSATLLFGTFGCAPVQLLEGNDVRIEQGMTEYQEAVEIFVNEVLANYESCRIHGEEQGILEQMQCSDGSEEVQSLCNEEIQAAREESTLLAKEACNAASYMGNRIDFYIPTEAKLSVLKSRAMVLDSSGICVGAIEAGTKALKAVMPDSVGAALGTEEVQKANNCTQAVVNVVIENHRALALNHRCIDNPAYSGCPELFSGIAVDDGTWNPAVQASFFLPTMLDTLIQNVRVVLVLEEAKKRGAGDEGR